MSFNTQKNKCFDFENTPKQFDYPSKFADELNCKNLVKIDLEDIEKVMDEKGVQVMAFSFASKPNSRNAQLSYC